MSVAFKILDETVHARIILDMKGFAREANIDPLWIDTPLGKVVDSQIVDWVRKFKVQSYSGLNVQNLGATSSVTICSAMAGAFLRNFISARVITLSGFLEELKAGNTVWESCILIPNFYMKGADGALPAWQVNVLLDGLVNLSAQGKKLVLMVEDFGEMEKTYGPSVRNHLKTTFQRITVI